MNNFGTLLANISRNNIHPPPEIEECKRIEEFNILIGRATNHLWKNSTTNDKSKYFDLAQLII
ncbi:hypothetical protein Glove_267g40 [Diversispora epigaea]|uniref:Uncharacterized protein n=1 Tax=Diversispora epigaea TaxID=1348612 RepID=A0A397IBS6_9GLOM|nr:hypothetical protein Glove_267g40 [Diversispora epigaea]